MKALSGRNETFGGNIDRLQELGVFYDGQEAQQLSSLLVFLSGLFWLSIYVLLRLLYRKTEYIILEVRPQN